MNEQANLEVSEPWTQKVRRAMNRFFQAMEKDGLNMTLEATAAYNELGGTLSGFIDAFESMQRDKHSMQARIDGYEAVSRREAIRNDRLQGKLNKAEDEIIDGIMREDRMQRTGDETHWRFQEAMQRLNATERRAKEFQKAYESIAADTKAKDEQIAALKNQLDVANSVILSQSQQLPVDPVQTMPGRTVEQMEGMAAAHQAIAEHNAQRNVTVQDLVSLIKKAYEQPLEKCPRCQSTVGFYTSKDGEKRCSSCKQLWEARITG